jgi:hypothetical protein
VLDVKLPDGSWVTTSMWAGFGIQGHECADHQWEQHGPVRQPEKPEEVPIQMERCSVCGWVRGRYLENPHTGK